MALLDFFRVRRDEVVGTKVLVCALDARFDALVNNDAATYKRYYPATTTATFPSIDALMEALGEHYDVVHVLCDIDSRGAIGDTAIRGTDLIDRCCTSGVKLLWIASDNDPQGYMIGFNPRGERLNLVMTLKRSGQQFSDFLSNLLSRMSSGQAMPVAWNELCPQVPGASHPGAPETIFFAGRGGVRLK